MNTKTILCSNTHTCPDCRDCLDKSLLNFFTPRGTNLEARSTPFSSWWEQRWQCGVAPYGRVLCSKADTNVSVMCPSSVNGSSGTDLRRYINFGSQDYLGLAQSEAVSGVAVEAIHRYGVHSAGSPGLIGRTHPVTRLEITLAEILGKESVVVYPSGWAAGYGAIAGLVRPSDAIVMDALVHNCLQEGAARSTENITKFRHNDMGDLERQLQQLRCRDKENGVFVVVESLYSMDADSPCVETVMRLAREYSAIVILDVAHDFGAMGDHGLGALESVPRELYPDVIMGSFSKTFASNGGFVACSRSVKNYLFVYSSPHLFSNAINPMQAAVAQECVEIVFCKHEGVERRARLLENVQFLRTCMEGIGCEVTGNPSPIVPVFVGIEKEARLIAAQIGERGLLANLVEFPAVPRHKARFRFQVMATHTEDAILSAAETFKNARDEVRSLVTRAASGAEVGTLSEGVTAP